MGFVWELRWLRHALAGCCRPDRGREVHCHGRVTVDRRGAASGGRAASGELVTAGSESAALPGPGLAHTGELQGDSVSPGVTT